MNHFYLNGIERPLPVAEDKHFSDLIEYVEGNLVSDVSLLSEIRVNGVDLSNYDEKELSSVPLTELDSIEIAMTHPKELAEDTLQNLLPYSEALAELSRKSAEGFRIGNDPNMMKKFEALIDGIDTFAQGISTVKKIYSITSFPASDGLENELSNHLANLLHQYQQKNTHGLIEMLNQKLPTHFAKWHQSGIPALIRSRDS